MNIISPPLKIGDAGPATGNLQDALLFLIHQKALVIEDPATRDNLLLSLKKERGQQVFGDAATMPLVKLFQTQQRLKTTGEIDVLTAEALNRLLQKLGAFELPPPLPTAENFVVHGRVHDASGGPGAGILVRAFDRDLRSEEPLGEPAVADSGGNYRIKYSASQFARAEKGTADLRVAAFNSEGKELVSSAIRFNAGKDETVDLQLPANGPQLSEFEKLLSELQPVLQGVELPELTEADLDFLTGDTGIDRARIALLRQAASFAQQISGPASTAVKARSPVASGLSTAVFFGWLRSGIVVTQAQAFWAQTTSHLIETLTSAIGRGIIPSAIAQQLDAIAAQIDQQRIAASLASSPTGRPASVGDLLATMPTALPVEHQKTVAGVLFAVSVDDPSFSKRLTAAGVPETQVVDIQKTLRLGNLTQQHAALTAALQPIVKVDKDASLVALAQLQNDDWLDLTYTYGSAAGINVTPEVYARQLASSIETLHPTPTLVAKLGSGALQIAQPGFDAVPSFLKSHADFDIATTNISSYLKPPGGSTDDKSAPLVDALGRLQRIRKLNTTWDEVGVLVNGGFSSSLDIVAAGADRVQGRVGRALPPERVDAVVAAAHTLHDHSLALMANSAPRFTPNFISVLPAPTVTSVASALQNFPTLQELFGSLDTCECRHCRSVLSPAAYFVDLLNFLKPSVAAFQRFYKRRPDLFDLELSCENTDTVLPYIDLVLEILENAVALPLKVNLAPGADAFTALSQVPLGKAITDVLALTAVNLGSGLQAESTEESAQLSAWTVTDGLRRWTIHDWNQSFSTQLTQSDNIVTTSQLQTVDVAGLIDGLNQSRLSSATQDWINSQLLQAAQAGANVGVFNSALATSEPGAAWTCHFQLGAIVEISTASTGLDTLTLSSASGAILFKKAYRRGSIAITTQLLSRGQVGGLLSALLPAGYQYSVKADLRPSRWTILSPALDASFSYIAEKIEVVSLSYQSSSTDRDLTIEPENRNPEAYRQLQSANFPWSLPFDLPLQEVRGFLEKANASRLTLLETSAPHTYLSSDTVALEVLGLSTEAADLITTPLTTTAPLWPLWGLTLDQNGLATLYDASAGNTLTGPPLLLLSQVSIVLQQARLEFNELLALLETRFIAGGASAIGIIPLDECDPSKLTFASWTTPHLDRLHRFVRLWRAVGWKPFVLDLALGAIPASRIDSSDTLKQLSYIVRLNQRLGLSVEQIAAWWGSFVGPVYHDYWQDGSPEIRPLYERIFLNPQLQTPPDPDLVPTGSPPILPSEASGATAIKLADKSQVIAAALKLRADDLQTLIADQLSANSLLTLGNLQILFRATNLVSALRLSVSDFRIARRLLGVDPFADATVTLQFCDDVATLRNSGFTFGELAYLFLHDTSPGTPGILVEEDATTALRNLRAVLHSDTQVGDAKRDLAIGQLADFFNLSLPVAQDLLINRLADPSDSTVSAASVFVDAAFTDVAEADTATTPQNFPDAFGLMQRLRKLAIIVSRLELDIVQFAWLASARAGQGGFSSLDLNTIPVSPPSGSIANLVTGAKQLLAICRLRDFAPGMPAMLTSYAAALIANDTNAARNVVGAALQITSDLVAQASGVLGISLTSVANYADPLKLTDLFALLVVLKNLGAATADVAALTVASPDFDASALARKLLLARNSDDVGQKLVHDVSDQLRTQQRDALVDILLTRDQLRSADELYEQYLIDVQMSPCLPTSRLVQAIASVQLYIQRCLANLEPDISLVTGDPLIKPDTLRTQWEWMKNYRVWEANRKIFLYPENWLYPDLRDNKTEIFSAYESDLAQNPPSLENAQDALLTYLSDLTEHAQISVLGMYLDTNDDSTLYAIGRSPNPPYQYFWRSCEHFGTDLMEWTGWEKVSLDLSSEHAIPFVFEGDLHVAWPVVQKSQSDKNDQPWQVQLAWARHTAKGWSKKKLSRDSLSVMPLANRDERTLFAFRASPAGEGMDILCYTADANNALGLKPDTADATDHSVVSNGVAEPDQSTWVNFIVRAYLEFDDSSPPTYQLADDVSFEGKGFICGRYYTFGPGPAPQLISLSGDSSYYSLSQWAGDVASSFVIGTFVKEVQNLTSSTAPFTLEFRATAKFAGQTLPQCTIVATLTPQQSQTCLLEFIFPAGTNTNPSIAGNIQLPMDFAGRFAFTSGRDVELIADKVLPTLTMPPHVYASMSGFKETSDLTHEFGFQIDTNQPVIFSESTTDLFFLCESGQSASTSGQPPESDLWYFEEGLNRYYLTLQDQAAPPLLTILPSSYTEASNFIARAIQGLDTLYDPAYQSATYGSEGLDTYLANSAFTLTADPRADLTKGFDLRFPCALYQWETFFHLPLRAAQHLTDQQRFEDAQTWLRLIFDPTTAAPGADLAKYWRFLPFQQDVRPTNIQQLLNILSDPSGDSTIKSLVRNQIEVWRDNPFRPYAVARFRPSAYQWSTVFAYLDNLFAWGDQLFRLDTRESIDEAVQYYVLAAKILGPRPRTIPARVANPALSYRELLGKGSDEFSNSWIELTDLQPLAQSSSNSTFAASKAAVPSRKGQQPSTQALTSLGYLYFCVPANDRLITYWDQVDDRLFKIRHCQNIEGVVRSLPLFQPPIDPGLLVRATAAGLDLATVFADQSVPIPNYRFTLLAQKTAEVCSELKSLSAGLLSVLERKDAEQLALLRSSQEIELLNLVAQVRQQQIDEAQAQVDGLLASQQNILERLDQYQRLLGQSGLSVSQGGDPVVEQSSPLQISKDATGDSAGLGLIRPEQDQLGKLNEALGWSWTAGIANAVASILHILPDDQFGSVVFQIKFGGTNLGLSASAIGSVASTLAMDASHHATLSGMFAGYQRRCDEWIFQSRLAVGEYKQLDKQIIAAQIRLAIAQNELSNHQKQIENAQSVDDFMRQQKFTNQDLYQWMVGQISGVFFQTYQLACDLAKRAESAFRWELGLQDSNFVQLGGWDSLKKGLLVGEKLHSDVRRMEAAYLDKNQREYELIKHVSLRQLDPLALLQLKVTGTCQIDVPEWLFDLECPGHYFRRLKNVGLSIPAVTGPYTSVNCTLSLTQSSLRISTALATGNQYQRDETIEDPRFVDVLPTITSIVTSMGNNDSGLFETNLRDERFLPFEGAGAESSWKLELPKDFPQFDYATIADVILHLRYTARQGGATLQSQATTYVKSLVAQSSELALLFSIRYDFSTEWSAFVNGTASFTAIIQRGYFPYFTQGSTIKISGFFLYDGVDPTSSHSVGAAVDLTTSRPTYTLIAPEDTSDPKILVRDPDALPFLIVRYSLV